MPERVAATSAVPLSREYCAAATLATGSLDTVTAGGAVSTAALVSGTAVSLADTVEKSSAKADSARTDARRILRILFDFFKEKPPK